MRRLLLPAAIALTLHGSSFAPAATPAGSWELLYVTRQVEDGSVSGVSRIMLLRSDGSRPTQLATGVGPEWSPDGSRIAFSGRGGFIEVMRADGTGRRRIGGARGGEPSWSPDGRLLAFSAPDGLTVSTVAGGATRVLSAGRVDDPAWSPDGRRLAFIAQEQGDADIAVMGADGSGRIVFADPPVLQPEHDTWEDERPRWSRDGRRIAFTRRYAVSGDPGFGNIWVSGNDGTGATEIEKRSCCAEWSADGLRLLHVQETWAVCIRTCFGTEPGEIAVVGRDGKGARLLTNRELPDGEPRWTPGERQVLFLSARDDYDAVPDELSTKITNAYVMNADGTCPTRLTSATLARSVVHARLRPGSKMPRLHCVDLFVWPRGPDLVSRATRFTSSVIVENVGDRRSAGATLTISTRAGRFLSASGGGARCRATPKLLRCQLPPIEPGRRRTIFVVTRSSTTVGSPRHRVLVEGRALEGDVSNNVTELSYRVVACTHLGTERADRIVGTARRDMICARDGDDSIRALRGDDDVNGGSGSDTIDAGPGRDTVRGTLGNDTILARDGERDVVSCGVDTDRVVADALDVIHEDCEQVELP